MRRLGGTLARLAAAWLARTWRYQVQGAEHPAGMRARGRRIVYAPWHAGLLPLVWWHRGEGIALLVSSHGDGDLLAGAARRWGYALARGSSTRGGGAGLRAIVRALAAGRDAGITPDGPRGPAGTVKPGVLAAARHGGAVIVPVAVHARPAVRLASWDRFLLPLPFARVRIVYGPPLDVTASPETAARRLAALLADAQRQAAA